ncbi:MAG: hypothetical protein UHI93_04590, partial [Acutalibacteraceae bacterium]|nr:hypothetical protein [Acutalibacteraceae bacterium]
ITSEELYQFKIKKSRRTCDTARLKSSEERSDCRSEIWSSHSLGALRDTPCFFLLDALALSAAGSA